MGDWSIYNSRSIIAFGCAGGPPPRCEELLLRSRLGLGLVSLSFLFRFCWGPLRIGNCLRGCMMDDPSY